MPAITAFEAANDPLVNKHKPKVTFAIVTGAGFQPGTVVHIGVFLDTAGRFAVAHATAHAGPNGSFESEFIIRPQLSCNTTLTTVVHTAGGVQLSANTDVFCP
jgi:hypothetical protein